MDRLRLIFKIIATKITSPTLYNYLLVYRAYTRAIVLAVAISAIFYNIVVIFAIKTFGINLQSSLLLNYDNRNVIVIVGSTFYMIQLWLEYPIIHFTAREGILTLIQNRWYLPTGSKAELKTKIGLAILFIACTYLAAVFVPQVMVIIQFAAIPNGILVMLFPGLCLMKRLQEYDAKKYFSRTKKLILWTLAVFYVVFGAFFEGYVIVLSLNSAIKVSNLQTIYH